MEISKIKAFLSSLTPKIDLSEYQTSGSVDKEIYDALVTLEWDDDCLEEN